MECSICYGGVGLYTYIHILQCLYDIVCVHICMCRCVDVCVCIWIIHRVSMSFAWYAMGVCSRESLYIAGSSLTVVPVALCVPGNGCVVTVGAVVCVGQRVVQPNPYIF